MTALQVLQVLSPPPPHHHLPTYCGALWGGQNRTYLPIAWGLTVGNRPPIWLGAGTQEGFGFRKGRWGSFASRAAPTVGVGGARQRQESAWVPVSGTRVPIFVQWGWVPFAIEMSQYQLQHK